MASIASPNTSLPIIVSLLTIILVYVTTIAPTVPLKGPKYARAHKFF